MTYDLHCHSHHSDGALAPSILLDLARQNHVSVLSITDHDTMGSWQEARHYQQHHHNALTLIPGIEFSTQWQKIGIHILGLNVDPGSNAIHSGVEWQKRARRERAERIAERLEKAGLKNALAGAQKIAGIAEISRPHFAQYMVEYGFSRSIEQAFSKYLGAGKPGDIKQLWAPPEEIIAWIRDSGGVAVLAHPYKYKLTRSKLVLLLDDFKKMGGQGMEVLSGNQDNNITAMLRDLCLEKNLLASTGSDFHTPQTAWCRLGMHPSLPKACIPVWSVF